MSEPIQAPSNLRELVEFLTVNPLVLARSPVGTRTFTRHAGGGLHFVSPNGDAHYLPINFGMTSAETALRFRPDGFDFTKFGITNSFDYLPEGPPAEGDWPAPTLVLPAAELLALLRVFDAVGKSSPRGLPLVEAFYKAPRGLTPERVEMMIAYLERAMR